MPTPLAALAAHWRSASIAIVAALIWIAHFDRWSIEAWCVPTDYFGDAPETLARLKAASEGDVLPLKSQLISRLGAPFGANWSAYPAPDKPLMLALGAMVHVVGLYAAANLGFVFAQVLAALAFYGVARWMRFRWEWAAAGSLLFAYTYHTFHRGLAHFSLVFTWTVPLGLAVVWVVAGSRRIEWRRPLTAFCLLTGLAFGTSNPYNLFFWLQLMGWALVWQWFGARRRANLAIGVATIGIALVAFALANAEMWLFIDNPDAMPLLARNYGGTEIYALKPVEMFIPPPFHHWDFMAFFGHRYARWSPWRGEVFLPYLGIVGIAAFVWLMIATVRRIVARRTLPGQAFTIGWILSYATIGGVTNLLALFVGFQVFRATNRAAVFISAILLFYLVGRLSRLSVKWPAWQSRCAAAALAAIGVFDQLPQLEKELDPKAIAAEVRADEALGRALENVLPDDAMIFQLPVVAFPESLAPHRLGEYDHFRPYLTTHSLRFSFGAAKMRARSRWQRELEGLPTAELVRRLESCGFSALYLNRKGFEDQGEKILRDLAVLGYTDRVEGRRGNQVVVLLRAARLPEPPLASSLTFGRGWHQRAESGWRWAYEDAALSYFNPYDRPVTVELRMNLLGATERELVIEHEENRLCGVKVMKIPEAVVISRLELAPGENRFKLRSNVGAVRRGPGRNQLGSFGVEVSSIRVLMPAAVPDVPAVARVGQL